MRSFLLLGAFLAAVAPVLAQTAEWDAVRALTGQWDGEESGDAGQGKGTRSYESVMAGKFVLQKNVSKFAPQPKNPEGETHEDLGIFSFDKARGKVIFRQFFVEGFVIRFVLDEYQPATKAMTFISESIENAPPGMSAKLVLQVPDPDRFTESFSVYSSTGERQILLENRWTRRRPE